VSPGQRGGSPTVVNLSFLNATQYVSSYMWLVIVLRTDSLQTGIKTSIADSKPFRLPANSQYFKMPATIMHSNAFDVLIRNQDTHYLITSPAT
jgi:hypothetical protein